MRSFAIFWSMNIRTPIRLNSGLLRLLTERQQNLCVVGDDDQSIYSWRGADSAHILRVLASVSRTRRSSRSIRTTGAPIRFSKPPISVIQNNPKRHPKKLWSERGTGSAITEVDG